MPVTILKNKIVNFRTRWVQSNNTNRNWHNHAHVDQMNILLSM